MADRLRPHLCEDGVFLLVLKRDQEVCIAASRQQHMVPIAGQIRAMYNIVRSQNSGIIQGSELGSTAGTGTGPTEARSGTAKAIWERRLVLAWC